VGIPPLAFWRLTVWEWARTINGYRRRQTEFWRMTRELYHLTHNLNVEKKHQKKRHELMPLPGDETATSSSIDTVIPPHIMIEQLNMLFGHQHN
jgi:hypothetical protein